MRTIETERLQLRPLLASDEVLFHSIYTDPELMRYVAPPLSAEGVRRSFNNAQRAMQPPWRRLYWILVDRVRQIDLGLVGLLRDAQGMGAEIGAMVLSPHQNVGYAHEALAAIIDHAFAELDLQSLHGHHPPANRRSVRLMGRLGFIHIPASEACSDDRWQLPSAHWAAERN